MDKRRDSEDAADLREFLRGVMHAANPRQNKVMGIPLNYVFKRGDRR